MKLKQRLGQEMSAARTALQALDRVYGLLGSNPQLTNWVTRDYFTAQSLFDALARMWAGAPTAMYCWSQPSTSSGLRASR